jgi:citrate lyase subunit beta/citryl-CoA lyase
VLALIESALGIEEAVSIARARGTFRLAFGSGDYRRDTGTSADNLAMAYPRSRLVVASRIGDLPGPIDGPTVGSSHPILREQSQMTVALGLTGKLCLDPEQTPVINEVISPTQSDVSWARDFLDDFEARGRVIRDGSDLPRLGRAQKIDKLARAFGVMPA